MLAQLAERIMHWLMISYTAIAAVEWLFCAIISTIMKQEFFVPLMFASSVMHFVQVRGWLWQFLTTFTDAEWFVHAALCMIDSSQPRPPS